MNYTARRTIIFVIFLAMILSVFYIPASAANSAETTIISQYIVYYSDGSRDVIVITEHPISFNRAGKVGSATKYHYSGNELIWKIVLTGTFTYNGTTSSCIAASTAVTFYKSGWSVLSENTSYSGNTAYTNVSLGITIFGVTLEADNVHLTLSCDKDGNLS